MCEWKNPDVSVRSHNTRQSNTGRAFRCNAKVGHEVAAYQRVFSNAAMGPLKSLADKPGLYKLANMANTFQLHTLISLVMSAMESIE